MKNNIRLLKSVLILTLTCVYVQTEAQTGGWKLAGNNLVGGEKLGSKNNFPVNIYTDNIQRMTIEGSPDGFVGIGTANPNAKLHVNGLAGNDGLRVQIAGTTKLLVHNGGGVTVGSSAIPPANGLFVNGNVGLGTTSPTSKLHVVGNIFATGNLDVGGTVGFGSVETFSDGGSFTIQSNSDIVPDADGSGSVGTTARTWAGVHSLSYFTSTPFGGNAKIQNLDAGLKEIMKLRPVSYTDGEAQKYALVGKEVQQVLPQVTRDWEMTLDEATQKSVKKTIDISLEYDAIIPVLIKGIQDQQNIIAVLEERIASLESALNSSGTDQMKSGSNLLAGVSLEQNQPNPFNQTTIIRYHLPQGASGVINIYSEGGILMKSMKTNDSGQATINGNDLKAGTYTYTLSVNGMMAASKKLVLIK